MSKALPALSAPELLLAQKTPVFMGSMIPLLRELEAHQAKFLPELEPHSQLHPPQSRILLMMRMNEITLDPTSPKAPGDELLDTFLVSDNIPYPGFRKGRGENGVQSRNHIRPQACFVEAICRIGPFFSDFASPLE